MMDLLVNTSVMMESTVVNLVNMTDSSENNLDL
jgi:hypothetical protein